MTVLNKTGITSLSEFFAEAVSEAEKIFFEDIPDLLINMEGWVQPEECSACLAGALLVAQLRRVYPDYSLLELLTWVDTPHRFVDIPEIENANAMALIIEDLRKGELLAAYSKARETSENGLFYLPALDIKTAVLFRVKQMVLKVEYDRNYDSSEGYPQTFPKPFYDRVCEALRGVGL